MTSSYEHRIRQLLSRVWEQAQRWTSGEHSIQTDFGDGHVFEGTARKVVIGDKCLQDCDLFAFCSDQEIARAEDDMMDPRDVIEQNGAPSLSDPLSAIWNSIWSTFASRFGASEAFVGSEAGMQPSLTVRPPHVLPHLVPVWLVLHTPSFAIVVKEREESSPSQAFPSSSSSPSTPAPHYSLTTILRFAFHNLDPHSQELNWLMAGVLECCQQLATRACFPVFSTHLFTVDESLWVTVDPLEVLLSMKRPRNEDVNGLSPSSDAPLLRLVDAQEEWRQRRLSNMDYLLLLNEMAGRKRGLTHFHPVMPWVVDFTSESGGWRPLNRTKFRINKGDDQLREMFRREPAHHIPELLSDIGYMVYRARIEKQQELCKHVRAKWEPREYPQSVRRMYEWTPDECIPELYEDPSLIASCHSDMPDLELPPFIRDAKHFVTWHRQCLESDEVSAHLHEWIDLAFGYQLTGEAAVEALNVPLSFVMQRDSTAAAARPKAEVFMTHGFVQLFRKPHPKRLPPEGEAARHKNSLGLNPLYNGILHGEGLRMEKEGEEKETKDDKEDDSMVTMYRRMLRKHRQRSATQDRSLQSLIVLLVEMCLPDECLSLSVHAPYCYRLERAEMLLRQNTAQLPRHLRDALQKLMVCVSHEDEDYKVDAEENNELVEEPLHLPPFKHRHFFLVYSLAIPPEVLLLHERIAQCYAYRTLRVSAMISSNERLWQQALHREVEAVAATVGGASRRRHHPLHPLILRLILASLKDPATAIPAVHRVFPLACRILSADALNALLWPLKRLLLNESTVKLVERRFLLQLSISFGARLFLQEFVPTLVEAVAARNLDRSIVAKDSILWLSRRYGPVVCARFLSANLLRIHATCYEDLSVQNVFDKDPLRMSLEGDNTGARVEGALTEIALAYSTTFVTVQYLPFCVDVVEGASRRVSVQMEPALVSALRILRLSLRALPDEILMNYLEDLVAGRMLLRIARIVCTASSLFSAPHVRTIVTARTLSVLHELAARIGAETARMYMQRPIGLILDTLTGLYEAGDDLEMQPRDAAAEALTSSFPVSFVRSAVSRFAADWGVPLLSSFCSAPACVVPFLTPTASSTAPTSIPGTPSQIQPSGQSASSLQRHHIVSSSAGNRLFSLSTPSSSPHSNSLGGFAATESTNGSLSTLWCARVSAAVCATGTKCAPPRFDQLSLCSFTGHSSTITALAVVSNENSFVSASTDKTVRLWSVSADRDSTQCQYAYKGHSKGVQDVCLLSTNAIASTDGILQIWDPFRGAQLLQLEWDLAEGNATTTIAKLANLDRHCILAASSLHASVKLLDLRSGGWVADLQCSPGAGLVRAIGADPTGRQVAVALSSGALALLDARTGRVASVCHGNGTHPTAIRFLTSASFSVPTASSTISPSASTSSFKDSIDDSPPMPNDVPGQALILTDADEQTAVFATRPRLNLAKRLSEAAVCCVVDEEREMIMTAHTGNNIKLLTGGEVSLETRIRSEALPGQLTSAARLPLNDAWLFGSSNGSIRLLC